MKKLYRSSLLALGAILFCVVIDSTNAAMIRVRNIINVGDPVNSMGDDFSPSLVADGSVMVFNSRLPDEEDHNIYITYFSGGAWSKPQFMEQINSAYNEETPYITPDGKVLLFASDRPGSMQPSVTADGNVRITYDIYISYNIGGRWTKPVPVPGDVNTTRNERSPSLSLDKKTLFFSRWRFRNIRNSKLMQASLRDNEYVDVRELPYPLNSDNFDMALTPSQRRPGFYLASRRPGGYGGWDLYFAGYKDGSFSEIINLGPEVNSADNELFLSEVDNTLYFCSDRIGSLGRYDIFSASVPGEIRRLDLPKTPVTVKPEIPSGMDKKDAIDKKAEAKITEPDEKKAEDKTPAVIPPEDLKPEKTDKEEKIPSTADIIIPDSKPSVPCTDNRTRIHVYVTDGETGKPLSIRFRIYLKNTDDPGAAPIRTNVRKSEMDGTFRIFPKGDVSWVVMKLDQEGYKPLREAIEVAPGRMKEVKITVYPDRDQNMKFLFKPVYFPFNSSHIRLEYYPYLHKIINYLREHPSLRLRITGHADITGSESSNYRISVKRARAVRDYFVKMGLHQKRFDVKGMGERQPVATQRGREFDELNRRVEFKYYK